MDHTSNPWPKGPILLHQQTNSFPPRTESFRHRGFYFARQAGTVRHNTAIPSWKFGRNWLRYASSAVIQVFPQLGPKPKPNLTGFRYNAPVANPDNFQFVMMGDTGMNSPGQYLVTTALSHPHAPASEFCMILGDVMYPTGGEEDYPLGLMEAFKYYNRPVLAIPGNHDWYDRLGAFRRFFIQSPASQVTPLEKANSLAPRLPNWFYFMDFGEHLRIICLDTGLTGTMEQNHDLQLYWLDLLLESAGDRKVVLMLHHPLYSLNDRGHEAKLRAILEPRFEKANVTAIFSGHVHNYQRHTVHGRQHVIHGAGGAYLHPLPQQDICRVTDTQGRQVSLTKRHASGNEFSYIHCHWRQGRLHCRVISAHQLPGRVLDSFVL